jgi:chromosome segregation ATPase
MNKFYIIVPVVLLAVFCVYYQQFSTQLAVIEARKAHDAAVAAEQVEQQKKDAEARAIAEAQAREKAQLDEEAKQEADHLAKFEASKQSLADETAKFQQEADSYAKQAADLQAQLNSLQADHENLSREVFDLQKQVELGKIDRRSADLEIQRTYDIVTQKIGASSLTYVPPPPATEAH